MIVEYVKGLAREAARGWPRFWFAPSTGYSLAVVRIATGLMLAYIHAVWWLRAGEFFGPDAMIDLAANRRIHELDYTFSYLRATDSLAVLWVHQLVAVLAALSLAAGLLTRLTAPLVWFMTLNVCHRATGHLFGLDQTAMMLAFALAFAPCGAVWSVDALLRKRWLGSIRRGGWLDWLLPSAGPSSMNTFAARLIQLQLCAIYLFGGLGKVRGGPWWDGTAIWLAAASWEYQSNDLTWIGRFPSLAAVLAHVTIFWETFYCVAVWPLRSRPIVLAVAVAVHAGIGIFLGMITFAAIMIAANVAFVPPEFTRRILSGGRRSPSPAA